MNCIQVLPQRWTCLQGASQNVTIVGQAGGKRRSIIEDILWLALSEPQLLLESIQAVPKVQDLLLLLGEAATLIAAFTVNCVFEWIDLELLISIFRCVHCLIDGSHL